MTTLEPLAAAGTVVLHAPSETHARRATSDELLLLATITPRPGERQPPASAAPERLATAAEARE